MSTAVAALLILLSAASPATGQVAYKPTVPTSTVCGHCCHEGTFCEATSEATALARAAGGLNAGDVIPAGTAMTCFLRDRDQPGAVDGGLCIPSSGVLDITSFCSDLSGTPESHVVPTIYEAGKHGSVQPEATSELLRHGYYGSRYNTQRNNMKQ